MNSLGVFRWDTFEELDSMVISFLVSQILQTCTCIQREETNETDMEGWICKQINCSKDWQMNQICGVDVNGSMKQGTSDMMDEKAKERYSLF